jgi:type I restriction enzyme S subunit
MAKSNTNPEVRFVGFSEDWEERELGEVAKFNPKHELPDVFNYVDLESVVGTEMISYRKEHKITAPSRAQRLAEKGDVFYQTVRPYQKNNLLFDREDKDFVFSTGYAQMRPVIESSFLFTLIQKNEFVRIVLNNCTGTSYPAINSTVLASIKQYIPKSKTEQKLIGNFFENIDNLITEHQHKHSKLKSLKQAMLDKMFPKQGQVVPEIRFKGFTDNWIQSDLKNILSFQYGIFNNNPNNGGEYPVYGANGVIGGYSEYNAIDSVVIGHMGEYAGIVLWADGKHFVTYNGIITKPKNEELLPKFGYFLLYKMNLRKICDGSGQPFLSYTILNNIKGIYPKSHEEQNKISKYFESLDKLIKSHELQITKMINIKNAFTIKMFL